MRERPHIGGQVASTPNHCIGIVLLLSCCVCSVQRSATRFSSVTQSAFRTASKLAACTSSARYAGRTAAHQLLPQDLFNNYMESLDSIARDGWPSLDNTCLATS
ncbi:hypothetical protein OH77DRAFT_1076932 [Trametes cingulata]|nr:hypothetical protein OH77DRAFT_1076932 [Trametes cingulata]